MKLDILFKASMQCVAHDSSLLIEITVNNFTKEPLPHFWLLIFFSMFLSFTYCFSTYPFHLFCKYSPDIHIVLGTMPYAVRCTRLYLYLG